MKEKLEKTKDCIAEEIEKLKLYKIELINGYNFDNDRGGKKDIKELAILIKDNKRLIAFATEKLKLVEDALSAKGNSSLSELEEKKIYNDALTALEKFIADIEKGNLIDSNAIETDIAGLEQHLKQWQDFAKTKSTLPEELKVMEENLAEIKSQWVEEKPKMEAYHKAEIKFQAALDKNASEEEIKKLFTNLETLANA